MMTLEILQNIESCRMLVESTRQTCKASQATMRASATIVQRAQACMAQYSEDMSHESSAA